VLPHFVGDKLVDESELLDQFIPVVSSLQGIFCAFGALIKTIKF
jgi:hypothetical protein